MSIDARTVAARIGDAAKAAALARVQHARDQHWSLKAAKLVSAVSLGAMAVAASTSGSDHHIMADGTKGDPKKLQGDPGGKPNDDVGQKNDAGEKSDPDSASNDLDEAGAPRT